MKIIFLMMILLIVCVTFEESYTSLLIIFLFIVCNKLEVIGTHKNNTFKNELSTDNYSFPNQKLLTTLRD